MDNRAAEIAMRENYEKILRNKGEYITHLVNLDTCTANEESYVELGSCIMDRREQLKKTKLNNESVAACLIQFGYACYVSLWYQFSLEGTAVVIDQREFDFPNEPMNLYVGYRLRQYTE